MNFKTFLSALSDAELIELEVELFNLRNQKSESNSELFSEWVEQNKSTIPEMIYRAFVRNFGTKDPRFTQAETKNVDANFILKFRGIGLVMAKEFLNLFPEFKR